MSVATSVGYDPLAHYDFGSLGLGEPIVDYLASKELLGRSEATLADKRRYLGSFANTWPTLHIGEVATRHCVHWLALQPGGETRRVRRAHLNDFLKWCVAWDLQPSFDGSGATMRQGTQSGGLVVDLMERLRAKQREKA